jgi:hypothetical protein
VSDKVLRSTLPLWERMKQTIASDPQLPRMELSVLWPRMLSRSGFVKQLSLVLDIVGIAVTWTDTCPFKVGARRVIGDIECTLNCHQAQSSWCVHGTMGAPDDGGDTVPADSSRYSDRVLPCHLSGSLQARWAMTAPNFNFGPFLQ